MINKKKYALISLFDKTNISIVCKILTKYNIGIISTGSTCIEIKKRGFKCQSVSKITKFPEILNGRVKTLHPKIHSSLLFKREDKLQVKIFKKLDFPIIDFLIVNLYPFHKVIKKSDNIDESTEMIDVGGPTLLRSAAKNFKSLTAICDLKDYPKFIKNLNENNGTTSLSFRKKMAEKVFNLTSTYDKTISNWLIKQQKDDNDKQVNKIQLKYGENPNQKSFFIKQIKNNFFSEKIQGKNLGYNNILDLDAGLNCLREFNEPTCVIIKHNNPCGVASGKSIYLAFIKALKSDLKSAFGGIVLLNRNVDKKLAKKISENFFEIIAAKKFNSNSLNLLSKKEKLILIKTINLKYNHKDEIKNVVGGQLIQKRNNKRINKKQLTCVSIKKIHSEKMTDLVFALKVAKHVKSNAIVLVKNKQTIGIGAGQMSRIDSVKLALMKNIHKNHGFVAASDAFFPFIDGLKLLIKHKCKSIIQPSGSINDNKIIDFANKNNLPLYFTKFRYFKH